MSLAFRLSVGSGGLEWPHVLALLYRWQHDLPGCVGLKAFLKAA